MKGIAGVAYVLGGAVGLVGAANVVVGCSSAASPTSAAATTTNAGVAATARSAADASDLFKVGTQTYRRNCTKTASDILCGPPTAVHDDGSDFSRDERAMIIAWGGVGWGAADIASAYDLPTQYQPSHRTIGIVDQSDTPAAEADMNVYRAQYGLPACTSATGCFKKVSTTGSTTNLPAAGPPRQIVETSIDLDMASAACPNCDILLVETPPGITGVLAGIDEATALGANVVSMSFGMYGNAAGVPIEDPQEATNDKHFSNPNVGYFAGSGDNGFAAVPYPAASPYVTAVGGTVLTMTNPNDSSPARGWTESVWPGGGSGCSQYEPKPKFQTDTLCATRTLADVSAAAQGVAIFASSQGGWQAAAGTSVSTPLVAGIYALTGHYDAGPSLAYSANDFDDVTTGTNGTCGGSALCTAAGGYDGPTGIGTPNGAMLEGQGTPWVASDSYVALAAGMTATVTVTLNLTTYPTTGTNFKLAFANMPPGVTASWIGGYAGDMSALVTFAATLGAATQPAGSPAVERTVFITNTLPGGQTYMTSLELKVGPCFDTNAATVCSDAAQCGGSAIDSCGNAVACAPVDCPANWACSSNHCCSSGTTWIAGKCASTTPPTTCPKGFVYCGDDGCMKGKCQ